MEQLSSAIAGRFALRRRASPDQVLGTARLVGLLEMLLGKTEGATYLVHFDTLLGPSMPPNGMHLRFPCRRSARTRGVIDGIANSNRRNGDMKTLKDTSQLGYL